MNSKVLNTIFLILMPGILFSQESGIDTLNQNPEIKELNYDTNYVVTYYDVFTLRFLLNTKKNEFRINDKKSDKTVNYLPNSPLNIGLGMTYKWLGLNIAVNLPFINNDDNIYGKTKRFDAQTNLYGRKYVLDLVFQRYKGFFVANPTVIIPGWKPGDPYPIRDDVKSFAMGFTGNYIFNNRKFSYRAAFNFNERQKKSAGSFTAGGGWLMFNLNSDTGLVPLPLLPDTLNQLNFKKMRLNSIYLTGGYAHSFIIRNWYFTLSLSLGGGVSTSKSFMTDNTVNKSSAKFSVVSDFRGSVGYNSDLFYVGLSWFTGAFSVNSSNDILLTYSLSRISLYVGYRFYNWFSFRNAHIRSKSH